MKTPTIIFEPHVPQESQFFQLIQDAERAFQKTYNYLVVTRPMPNINTDFVAPLIILSDAVISYTNHYDFREAVDMPRLFDDFDEYSNCERIRNGIDISTIVLHQYVSECHSIILYYNAIEKFATDNGLAYQNAYEYAMVSALLESLHHEVFPGAFIFQKHKKPQSNDCQTLTCSLYDYYAYCYCFDCAYSDVSKWLFNNWKKYFYTTYPYAAALYFTFRNNHRLSYDDSIKKHQKVFSLTNGPYKQNLYYALNELYRK